MKIVYGIAGISVYGIGLYGCYHAYRIYNLPLTNHGHDPKNQRNYTQQYTKLTDYDDRIDWDEFMMRLTKRRQELAELAVGDVLETSAGTCRNLEYYIPQKISSLTLVDACESMLQSGLVKMRPFKKAFESKPISFKIMNSEQILYPNDKFDTVIDTFGLCSHQDPIQALQEMGRVCQEHGQILLLEHGRSKYEFLNTILDKLAPEHAKNWGCWWNRDIVNLVQESGLRIIELETFHFGTTYKIIAKPNKKP